MACFLLLWCAWMAFMPLDAVRFGWSNVRDWVRTFGALAILVSVGVSVIVMRENSYAAAVVKIQTERGQTVVTTGPYRIVRHPMYASAIPFFIGTGLLVRTRAGAFICRHAGCTRGDGGARAHRRTCGLCRLRCPRPLSADTGDLVMARYGFDVACGARRRGSVGVDENLDEADREARAGVDGRIARRVPALAEQAGSFAGPDRMFAGDDAPKAERHGWSESRTVFERVEDLLRAASAQVGSGSVDRAAPVKLRVWRRHEFACLCLGAESATRMHEQPGNAFGPLKGR